MATTHQAVRRWILTGAVFSIAATGAVYGAQLRGEQDGRQEKKRVLQLTPEERIAQLEAARAELVGKKNEMERKLNEITARRAASERAGKDAN